MGGGGGDTPTYSVDIDVNGTYTFPEDVAGYGAQTPKTVTIANTGNQPTGALSITLSGTGSGSFTLNKPAINNIAVDGTDTFTVVPQTGFDVGTYTATVTVSGNNGITAGFNVSFTVDVVPSYGVSLSESGTHSFPAAAFGYGTQTQKTVTISNTGNQPTGALNISLSGTNPGSFTLNKPTINDITADGTDTFTVVPNTGLGAGTYTAAVTVSGGSGITAGFNVSFTVNPVLSYGVNLDLSGTHSFPAAVFGYGTQTQKTVTISNTGNQPTGALSISLSGTNSGSFTLSTTTAGSIAVDGTDTFTVVPVTGLVAGTYTAAVTVSGGSGITAGFNVSFTVNPAPSYSVNLDLTGTHSFPAAAFGYGTQTQKTVTISNTGNQPTGALSISLSGTNSGSFTLSKTTASSIAVDGTDTFTVVPQTGLGAGTYTATVTVSGGSVSGKSFEVSFTVNPAPSYSVNLDLTGTHSFPAAAFGYGTQTPKTVTISNTGNQPTGALTIALSGTNPGSFTLNKTSINGGIAVSGTDTFTVVPNTGLGAGTYTATVTVSGGSVSGKSFEVSFTVNPASYGVNLDVTGTHSFPAAAFGYGTQTQKTVTISNTGNQPTGALSIALSGTNPGAFTLNKTSINGSIAVSGTDTFTVVPNTGLGAGTYTAAVTVSGGSVSDKTFNVSFTVNPASYGVNLSETGTHTFPAAVFGYGTQTQKTVTISNTGNQPTGALSIALSGTNPGAFTLSKTTAGSIAVDGTDTFTVVPNTGLGAGTYTATVTVSGGSVNSKSFNLSFTVNPVPSYGVDLDLTGTHSFPAAAFGYGPQMAASVTISNTGNQPTGALNISLSGTNPGSFTLSKTTADSIAVDETDTFTVVPNTGLEAGTYTAAVTVSGGNGITAGFNVSFTVNPASYGVDLSETGTHSFPAAVFGYGPQTASSVTISNTGNQPTGALNIALSGTNSGSFTLSKTTAGSIAVDGTDTFTVVPNTGLDVWTYTATVTVSGGSVSGKSFEVSFTVNPAALNGASVNGLVSPAGGAAPVTAGSLTGGTGYTVQSIAWSPTVTGTFAPATAYTATIVLKAGANYRFAGTITPYVNAGTPAAGTLGGTGAGNTLAFTVSYPATTGTAGINITAWVNEDGTLIVGYPNPVISRSAGDTLTVTAAAGLSSIQWSINGTNVPAPRGTAQSFTIPAANYPAGTYILGLQVVKDGVPYSTSLDVTVTN